MTDKEQLIADLRYLLRDAPEGSYKRETLNKAIAALEEQEPVKPNISCDSLPDEGGTWWYECGNCNNAIDPDDAYCRHCGKAVKWYD